MEKKICKSLVNGLCFHHDNIRFCTTLNPGPIIEYSKDMSQVLNEIIEKREHNIDCFQKDTLPKECDCCIYNLNENVTSKKINKIDFFHWLHCNCGCYYCSNRDLTKGKWSDKEIEGNPIIYSLLKELFKRDMVDKEDLFIVFGGGEIGVLKEFPKIIDFLYKNNIKGIFCETSGIRYLKPLEKFIKIGKAGLTVAVCCGDRELYKKIKGRDKYKDVMNNLKRYQQIVEKYSKDKNDVPPIVSKFIILEGFNNNIEEVEKWLLESVKYGLKNIEISMEYCWGAKRKKGQPIEEYNKVLFDYTEKRAKELGLNFVRNSISYSIMENGFY